jgi:putative transposase
MPIFEGEHVVYTLHAHLVFVTKYRRDARSQLAICDLAAIFAKVCNDFDCELMACDGEDDHVHLLGVPRKSRFPSSSIRLKACRAAACERCGQRYEAVIGVAFCGRRPTSSLRGAVRLSPLSLNTFTTKGKRTRFIPVLEAFRDLTIRWDSDGEVGGLVV